MTYLSLEDINFGGSATNIGSISVDRPRMRLASTSTSRETLARKERESAILCRVTIDSGSDGKALVRLVFDSSNITRVVSVRPLSIITSIYRQERSKAGIKSTHHAFETSTIPSPSKVTHRPDSRPQADDVIHTRKDDRRLDQTASETELVPR